MKYAEINKAFTEAVATKIAQGYTICTNTMGGTQGEIVFVNFTKDGKFYALTLDSEHHYGDDNYLEVYAMRWVVSTELSGDCGGRSHVTMWRGEKDTTTLEEVRWYKVERCDWFVGEEEAKAITAKIRERWHRERGEEEWTLKVDKKACKTIAAIYKRFKMRGDAPLAQKDILSARVTHFKNGRSLLYIVKQTGSAVSVSFNYARN